MNLSSRIALALGLCGMIALGGIGAGYRLGLEEAGRARPAVSSVIEAAQSDPMEDFRTQREQLRQRQSAQLNDIIYNSASDAETIQLAQRQLMTMLDTESIETRLEGLLGSRGFEGALVDAADGAVSVLVRTEALTRQQSAVILELVMRETGVTGGNVKIIPVN